MDKQAYTKPHIECFCIVHEQLLTDLSVPVSNETTNEDAGAKDNSTSFYDEWNDDDADDSYMP